MKIIYENQNLPQDLKPFVKENRCGFLNINDENYFISPKISNNDITNQKVFMYMLFFSYDIKISNEDLANFENQQFKIFDIFIRYFTEELLKELKKGIYKTYIVKDENLKVLKGSYLIEKNFTNFYHQNIYCQYDEFSMDNQLNRFFLYAINTFLKHSNYENLYKCKMIFDEVEKMSVDIDRLNIHFDRLNQRYEKSFKLAIMILKALISDVKDANKNSFTFLFDMAEVFEKFVGNIYKKIDTNVKLQSQRNFGNLQLKPDIISNNTIIDTKYKIVKNKEDLATNDKYQMFTYGINFNIRNTMLLYPKHLFDIKEDLKLGINENCVELKMRSLDLNFDGNYKEFIEEIKIKMEELRCQK